MALVGTITTVSTGTAVPSNADGADGGIYFQVLAGNVIKIWKKDSGAWSLVGDIVDASAWTAFNPSMTAATGTLTSATSTGLYKRLTGKTVAVKMEGDIVTNGTGGLGIFMQLPFNTTAQWGMNGIGSAPTFNKALIVDIAVGSHQAFIMNYDGTYPGANNTNLLVFGTYETV